MNLNRSLQLRMLQALKGFYPANNPDFIQQFGSDPDYIANLHYLRGHGLLTWAEYREGSESQPPRLLDFKITLAGLDFLEDDGGIGAILRTVAVRLEAHQLRHILAAIKKRRRP
jgi:hypothetical protein